MWKLSLLGSASAYLSSTGIINVSAALGSSPAALRVVFYDFDRTLAVDACGHTFLEACSPNCATYTPAGACSCNSSDTAFADYLTCSIASRVLQEPDVAINGTDRRDRLIQHFTNLTGLGIQVKIVSTSWYYQSAANWQNFLASVMQIAGLGSFFPKANILTLADPGSGLAANKSSLIGPFLSSRGWGPHNGLLVDDSAANIALAAGAVDWMQVVPDSGLASPHLDWIESRAAESFDNVCVCLHGTATVSGAGDNATLCETDNTEDCSACNAGYALSAPAGTGLQVCHAVNCTAMGAVANGNAGTCTTDLTTGQSCSINCDADASLTGPATQNCQGTGPGAAAFELTQTCEPLTCPVVLPAEASAGNCTGVRVGASCSLTCNAGFRLSNALQTCQQSGRDLTFANAQTCQAVNCTAMGPVANGNAGTCTTDVTTGQNCSISCDADASLTGPATQNCEASGPGAAAFELTQTCELLTCPLVLPSGASAGNCTGVRVGESCSLECAAGFRLSNASQTCQLNGRDLTFANAQTCQAVMCAPLSVANGTSGSCVNKSTGQNCSIACEEGFAVAGPAVQYCNGTGPAASAFTNTQSCQELPLGCPTADIELFLTSCTKSDIEASCKLECRTAAQWMTKAFAKITSDLTFVDQCIRNAASNSSLVAADISSIITRVSQGQTPCQVSAASALSLGLSALLVGLFM